MWHLRLVPGNCIYCTTLPETPGFKTERNNFPLYVPHLRHGILSHTTLSPDERKVGTGSRPDLRRTNSHWGIYQRLSPYQKVSLPLGLQGFQVAHKRDCQTGLFTLLGYRRVVIRATTGDQTSSQSPFTQTGFCKTYALIRLCI